MKSTKPKTTGVKPVASAAKAAKAAKSTRRPRAESATAKQAGARAEAALPQAASPSAEPRPKVSLDEGKRREVIAILSVGCSRTTAAQYVGCHATTITRTALRDPDFERQVRQAESMLELKHLRNIDAAAKDTRYWRAAAWALERKYPERWGQRRAHALSAEQVGQALEQFAQLVIDEVTEVKTRDRILKRLDELTAALAQPEKEATDDEL